MYLHALHTLSRYNNYHSPKDELLDRKLHSQQAVQEAWQLAFDRGINNRVPAAVRFKIRDRDVKKYLQHVVSSQELDHTNEGPKQSLSHVIVHDVACA